MVSQFVDSFHLHFTLLVSKNCDWQEIYNVGVYTKSIKTLNSKVVRKWCIKENNIMNKVTITQKRVLAKNIIIFLWFLCY